MPKSVELATIYSGGENSGLAHRDRHQSRHESATGELSGDVQMCVFCLSDNEVGEGPRL